LRSSNPGTTTGSGLDRIAICDSVHAGLLRHPQDLLERRCKCYAPIRKA
jgi:hypothetical protein